MTDDRTAITAVDPPLAPRGVRRPSLAHDQPSSNRLDETPQSCFVVAASTPPARLRPFAAVNSLAVQVPVLEFRRL
jgi:hypothetical protein